jgi:hypothetical protein
LEIWACDDHGAKAASTIRIVEKMRADGIAGVRYWFRRHIPSTNEPGLKHNNPPLTYKEAGVDIDAGDALVEHIKPLAKSTDRAGVMGGLGGFGGLFDLKAAGFKDPILVSGTDGVGTKLKVAIETGMPDTVGMARRRRCPACMPRATTISRASPSARPSATSCCRGPTLRSATWCWASPRAACIPTATRWCAR